MGKKVEVKTYMVYKICPLCEGVVTISDQADSIRLTYPPQYKYKCDNCGWELWSTERYPKIEYEPVENS